MNQWHLKGAPLKVQAEAIRRGQDKPRYGMWLDMGLAKTATDLHEFIDAYGQEKADAHVIIAPNHLKFNWVEEMDKWHPSPMPTTVWPDEPKKTDINFIINYEALQYSGLKALKTFMKGRKVIVSTDESHRFKTFNSETAKLVLGHVAFAPETVGFRELTGTPRTKTVMDYWPQMRALDLLRGTNPYAFRNRYAVMGGYMGKQITGSKNEEELKRILDPHVFMALYEDWTDAPATSSGIVSFEMDGRQLKIYKEMQQDFLTMVQGQEVSADMVITQLRKLQQIGRGFVLIDGQPVRIFDSPKKNPSFKALLAAIQDAPGKVIVFTLHRAVTQDVFETLNAEGIGTAVIQGGMKPEAIQQEKRDFNNNPRCRVIVLQTSVGKEGHTLLGDQSVESDACFTTMYYEDTYNWGDRKQSSKRNRRTGQKYPVRYLDFVGSPMDARIAKSRAQTDLSIGALVDILKSMPRSQ